MNIFNRLLAILVLLVLLALAVLLSILPTETLQVMQRGLEGFQAFILVISRSYAVLFAVGRVALAVVAILLFGGLLIGQFRRARPRAVQVHSESGSRATVTTDSIARRLSWHIDQLADVINVTPHVTAAGKAVNVRLDLETRPEVDVPMKTDEVVAVAREVITERMGLQLGKIEVRISHGPYQEEA